MLTHLNIVSLPLFRTASKLGRFHSKKLDGWCFVIEDLILHEVETHISNEWKENNLKMNNMFGTFSCN